MPLRSKDGKLTLRQKKFADLYHQNGYTNARQAYIDAGYKGRGAVADVCASQLLSNPKVMAYLKELQAVQTNGTVITVSLVLNTLWELSQKCMQAVPVLTKIDGELVETGEYKLDSFGANKALELIAKHLGMFEGKGENKPDNVSIYQIIGGGPNGDSVDKLRADLKRDTAILFNKDKVTGRL